MGPSSGANGGVKKPHVRRGKPRPKFEVPPEVAAAPLTPWVWNGEPAPLQVAPPPPARTPEPTPAAVSSAPASSRKGPLDTMLDPASLMLAAIETMAHTVAASTRLMLAAASILGAPIQVTRKILGL